MIGNLLYQSIQFIKDKVPFIPEKIVTETQKSFKTSQRMKQNLESKKLLGKTALIDYTKENPKPVIVDRTQVKLKHRKLLR
jgi:hypothetical protein